MREKMATFKQFAGASLDEIYAQRLLDEATLFTVNHLESGILLNGGSVDGVPQFSYTAPWCRTPSRSAASHRSSRTFTDRGTSGTATC